MRYGGREKAGCCCTYGSQLEEERKSSDKPQKQLNVKRCKRIVVQVTAACILHESLKSIRGALYSHIWYCGQTTQRDLLLLHLIPFLLSSVEADIDNNYGNNNNCDALQCIRLFINIQLDKIKMK